MYILLTTLKWLNITPFGRPVVPLEYTKNAKSLSQSTGSLSSPLACPSISNSRQCVKSPSSSSPINTILSLSMPASSAAFTAIPSKLFCVSRALAPESFKWWTSSRTVYAGLAGLTIPPAQCTPHVMAGVSMQFCAKSARTSFFFQFHFERSPVPNLMVVDFRCVKV